MFAIGIAQNLCHFFKPRLSQTQISRFVFVTTFHLKARISKNKAFRNCYLCGVLKHSKIKRCIVAGQWNKILAINTISWTKRPECKIWTSTGTSQQLMIPHQTGSDCPQSLSEEEWTSHLWGASIKDMWEVQDWSPTLRKGDLSPGERQQEWEGLWDAYIDLKLWIWYSNTWWGPLTGKTLLTLSS